MNEIVRQASPKRPDESLLFITYLIYALHAVSAVSGLLSPALIITTFITGWPSIIAVILNYVKRADVQGGMLESHFRWQIRTFWFALLWVCVAWILIVSVIGFFLGILLAWLAGAWVVYRIARGLIRLMNGQPMPMPEDGVTLR